MEDFKEIIPVSNLLDEELNSIRGGSADNTVAECGGGKKVTLSATWAKSPLMKRKI